MLDALRRRISRRRWNQRRVVHGIHESPPDSNDEQHDAHLQDYDETIHKRRFLGAADKQKREEQKDEYRRDIHDAVRACGRGGLERRVRPLVWNAPAEPVEHTIEIRAPRDGNGGRAYRIFEN